MAKNTYEAMLVFSIKDGDELSKALTEKFKALIEANGELLSLDEEWGGGNRRLAYEIDHQKEGHYILAQFESEPEFPAELDRIVNITDGVLSSLITRV